jgi:uracil permease
MSSTEKEPIYQLRFRDLIFGIQILCVAFGGLVLVPIIAGLDPNVALFTAGIGTLIFQSVTGAVAITKIKNPAIMTWASISAVVLSFCGKLGAFLQIIPAPVMGGILVILFGTIVVIGIQSLLNQNENLMKPRNLVIISVILVFGVGGMSFRAGDFALEGIGLCSITSVWLNLLLPQN